MSRPSLRAEQVAQTKTALVAAGRALFGRRGFAETSVEDLATEARVTTGALYHHFPTKTALFEMVFEDLHSELLALAARGTAGASDETEYLVSGFAAFLDAMLRADVQRILVSDGPAVLGLERFVELDERYAVSAISGAIRSASVAGRLHADDPDTLARLLLGALARGAMLIASAEEPTSTRDAVVAAVRSLLGNLSDASRT